MKKRIFFAVLASLTFIYSCKKKDNVVTNLDLLQHKWTNDSIIVYGSSILKIPYLQGYSDFRTDGKLYSFSSFSSNGVSESIYDTSLYSLKDSLIITFPIKNGVVSRTADTSKFNILTDKILVIGNVTKDIDGTISILYLHR